MTKESPLEKYSQPFTLNSFLNLSKRVIMANLESAGIIIEKITFLRVTVIISAIIATILFWYFKNEITFSFAIWYAAFHFIFRQGFLFLSFTPKGIAYQLKKRFGEKRGYDLYEFFTAMSYFHRSYSFYLFVQFTAWQGLSFLKPYSPVLSVIGDIFSVIGIVVNTWCFLLIKRETYYYLDMFLGRFLVDFNVEGPYKIMKNPMYSVGQLPAYGLALASGSLPGILLTLLNQICAYVFYYTLELPHIEKLIAKEVLPVSGLVPEVV